MSRAEELSRMGWPVQSCAVCGRAIVLAKDDHGTAIELDANAACYSLHGDREGVSRQRGAYASHHAICRPRGAAKLPALVAMGADE